MVSIIVYWILHVQIPSSWKIRSWSLASQSASGHCVLARLTLDSCTQMVRGHCRLPASCRSVTAPAAPRSHINRKQSAEIWSHEDYSYFGWIIVHMYNWGQNSSCSKRHWNAMVSWKVWYKTDEWGSHGRWWMNERNHREQQHDFY